MIVIHPKKSYQKMLEYCKDLAVQSNDFGWTDLASKFQNLGANLQPKADRYKKRMGFLKSVAEGLAIRFLGYDMGEIERDGQSLYSFATEYIHRLSHHIDEHKNELIKEGCSRKEIVGMQLTLLETALVLSTAYANRETQEKTDMSLKQMNGKLTGKISKSN